MRYPFKVIVKGKLYGEASTLAEAQSVANDRGGYVACECRHANPDLLTGKIRQREDGGHYVRTRKDKRPAEVDVTAEQVAGDWRTQLAHSGHAPAPKPPKAPKVPKARAPKAGKPTAPAPAPAPMPPRTEITDRDFYALGDRQVSDLARVLWLELRTKRDAIGFCAALCEDVNFSGPKLPTPDFRDTTPDVSDVAKQLDWDIGLVGWLCWRILTEYGAREEANEVKRATKQEMQESSDAEPPRPRPRQPRPEVEQSQSFQLAAARYPKLSQKRLKLLAMAIDLGASDAAIAVFAAAKTVAPNSATVIVPFGRYATETRNDGFARTRTKPNYRYAEKGPSGWILDNKSPYYSFADWEVVSKGPHDQETREMYHVGQYNVGGSPWTYAMLDK